MAAATFASLLLSACGADERAAKTQSAAAAIRSPQPQAERISLLERPVDQADAPAQNLVLRSTKDAQTAASARLAFIDGGSPVYAYRKAGEICIAFQGGGCTVPESAATDEPLLVAIASASGAVELAGLLHDGPQTVTIVRRDGSTSSVEVKNNMFVLRDRNVARLEWDGLRGRIAHQLDTP